MYVLDNPRSTIRGVFLLILAIMGNFTVETLGCRSRKLLTENMPVKHLVSIFILYFSIGIFSKKQVDPIETFKTTIKIYVMFILFTRMNIKFTIIVFLLLAINYIIWNYIDYFKTKEDDKYKSKIDNLVKFQNNIFYLILVLILIGFILYTREQYSFYKKEWSTVKFLFGTKGCKTMQ
jgi:hypothetical protein